jgi:phosphohistidine phosphatase
MRHGETLSGVPDGRRPLSERGRSAVTALAQRAMARGVAVAWIYHSGILRAQQTAELVAEVLTPAEGVRELAGLCPDDDPFIVQAELAAASQPIMLVSHLPYVGRLASLLISGDSDGSVIEFAPATLACMTRHTGGWKLRWSISPAPR